MTVGDVCFLIHIFIFQIVFSKHVFLKYYYLFIILILISIILIQKDQEKKEKRKLRNDTLESHRVYLGPFTKACFSQLSPESRS